MPRSILTEKLSRRGYHLTREYGTDPLETVSLAEVMAELGQHDCAGAAPARRMPEVFAYSDETSLAAVEKMATSGLTALLVVDRATQGVCGSVSLKDLLLGRRRADETRTAAGSGCLRVGGSGLRKPKFFGSIFSQRPSTCAMLP